MSIQIEQDKQVQEKNISELQNDDLKLETTLQKRSDNRERLQKTLSVDQGLLDNTLKENDGLKDTISNFKLELEITNRNLGKQTGNLQELLSKKKFIEHRVKLHRFFFSL